MQDLLYRLQKVVGVVTIDAQSGLRQFVLSESQDGKNGSLAVLTEAVDKGTFLFGGNGVAEDHEIGSGATGIEGFNRPQCRHHAAADSAEQHLAGEGQAFVPRNADNPLVGIHWAHILAQKPARASNLFARRTSKDATMHDLVQLTLGAR